MKTERVNGRTLVVSPSPEIHVGSTWAPADGGNRTVTVAQVDTDRVVYEDPEDGSLHERDHVSFQRIYRLCL